jgi:8-oxo-dGTP diphosphatase
MIVKNGDKILLIERKKYPFGFAPPAGHVDDGEDYDSAAKRELFEEVGIKSDNLTFVTEGRKDNSCRRPNGSWHYWKIYELSVANPTIVRSLDETKQARWCTLQEIRELAKRSKKYSEGQLSDEEWEKAPGIELVWYDWLREIGLL